MVSTRHGTHQPTTTQRTVSPRLSFPPLTLYSIMRFTHASASSGISYVEASSARISRVSPSQISLKAVSCWVVWS